MQWALQYNATADKKKIKVIQSVVAGEYETLELRIGLKSVKALPWSLLGTVFRFSKCLLSICN